MSKTSLRDWADTFLGRELTHPHSSKPASKVVSWEIGTRKTGVWLRLANGIDVYKKIPRSVVR